MELDRIVQVRVGIADRPGRAEFATGYLVAPRLVLTTGHVFGSGAEPSEGPVTVCRPGACPERFAARRVWRRKDESVDAALVEVAPGTGWQVPASLRDLATRPPQRWGTLIGARPHPVTACGYPRTQKADGQGDRLTEQLDGRVHPATGRPAPRYEISSTDPALPHTRQPGSDAIGWSGISGAALLCPDRDSGDLLIGVLAGDRQARNGARMTATRTCDLLTDPDFRRLVTEHCRWEPLLEPAEPALLLAPAARARDLRSPAMVLRADTEAVTFHGRTHELQQLTDWCAEDRNPFAVRVLTGPGGQGKTRLARHLASTLRESGWVTAHLRRGLKDDPADRDWSSLDTDLPLLVTVDYAETMPHQARQLIEHLRHTRHRVRLLLLARAEGDWKSNSLGAGSDTGDLLADAPTTELGPLLTRTTTPCDRADAYTRALTGIARLLEQVHDLPHTDWNALATALDPPPDLAHPRYDTALTLQMTALAALLQHGPDPVPDTPGRPVEEVLLRHEARYWHGTAASAVFHLEDLTEKNQRLAVAAAVAFGAATAHEGRTTLEALPGLPPGRHGAATEWLCALYPPAPGDYWGSLQPDRLAEYHASTHLTGPGDQVLTALWTAASAAQQTQALTVLARAAIAHANTGRTTAETQVLHALDTALDTAAPGPEVLQAATAALPRPSRTLAPLALRLNHGLSTAYRRLAAANPDAYEPDLAMALNNLSVRFGEVGRQAEGLAASEEASTLRRRLAAANPDAYEPDLASSLNNLSIRFGEVGRQAEGLAASEEATTVYRRLAAANPDAYEPALATSLWATAWTLVKGTEDLPLALEAVTEAVELFVGLAEQTPAAYGGRLRAARGTLAEVLEKLGRHQEAADMRALVDGAAPNDSA